MDPILLQARQAATRPLRILLGLDAMIGKTKLLQAAISGPGSKVGDHDKYESRTEVVQRMSDLLDSFCVIGDRMSWPGPGT